ncbi:hypothetical protein [Kiritimatiella glycovorans]|uniref:Lipoprotein n=1 Tax=Kiritimatiella glycovorans TaxID=1307763 RepID=A0A0G3EEZ8_9BACT|nr:hypothetical protein [Kiritimatiella glycovorans]AKJ63330.1 hypothetical protein L21SP4_00041 [Kiritimatiella glycovorans]
MKMKAFLIAAALTAAAACPAAEREYLIDSNMDLKDVQTDLVKIYRSMWSDFFNHQHGSEKYEAAQFIYNCLVWYQNEGRHDPIFVQERFAQYLMKHQTSAKQEQRDLEAKIRELMAFNDLYGKFMTDKQVTVEKKKK